METKACDLRLQPRTQLSGSHPAGSRRASIFPITSPDEICPPQKRSPTRTGRHKVAKRPLSLVQHDVTVVVAGHELSTFVGQIWMRRRWKLVGRGSWSALGKVVPYFSRHV